MRRDLIHQRSVDIEIRTLASRKMIWFWFLFLPTHCSTQARYSRTSGFPRIVGNASQLPKVSRNGFPGHHDERDPWRMELMLSKTPTSPLASNNSIVARFSFFEEPLCAAFSILRTLSYRIISLFAFYGESAVTFGTGRGIRREIASFVRATRRPRRISIIGNYTVKSVVRVARRSMITRARERKRAQRERHTVRVCMWNEKRNALPRASIFPRVNLTPGLRIREMRWHLLKKGLTKIEKSGGVAHLPPSPLFADPPSSRRTELDPSRWYGQQREAATWDEVFFLLRNNYFEVPTKASSVSYGRTGRTHRSEQVAEVIWTKRREREKEGEYETTRESRLVTRLFEKSISLDCITWHKVFGLAQKSGLKLDRSIQLRPSAFDQWLRFASRF